MTPSAGMQYSVGDLCELARRLSAASQRVASSFSMSCTWVMAPVKASVARLVRERDSDHRGPVTPKLDCHSRSQNALVEWRRTRKTPEIEKMEGEIPNA